MHIIHRSLDLSNYYHIMLWAACCMGFFGFLRAGEFTVNSPFDPNHHLTSQDLQVAPLVNPLALKYIRERPTLCPIAAIIQYLKVRSIDRPLFINLDGSPLTRQALSTTIQSILQAAGVQGQFSGHSFRIGAATTAAGQGVQDHLIKTLGRWSSDAYQRYIRTPVHTILSVSEQLV